MARKEKHIHYLYKTTCNVTGRWYIGMHSTNNLEDGYMGSGLRLRRSIRKYGIDNHTKEILEYFESRELLIEAEKDAITEDMINDDNCMNLMSGGNGGFISEEHYNKLGNIGALCRKLKLENDSQFKKEYYEKVANKKRGQPLSDEHKDKLSIANKGKIISNETKLLMSEKAKLRTPEQNSQYGTCWVTKDGENKKIKKEELEIYLNDNWLKGKLNIQINILNEMKILYDNGYSYRKLEKEFNISKTTIIKHFNKLFKTK